MSVPWSAPEVITEKTSGTIASEVWGLGATVYSLLAGHSPFERREKGQNTREHLRRRIVHANYPPLDPRRRSRILQEVLATAMNRDPDRRYAGALPFGEALRAVQAELGLDQTPLEVAVDEWAAPTASVDFADAGLRGPARPWVPQDTTRKAPSRRGVAALARDEDTDISSSAAPARKWPWIAGAAVVVAVAVIAGALGALFGAGASDAASAQADLGPRRDRRSRDRHRDRHRLARTRCARDPIGRHVRLGAADGRWSSVCARQHGDRRARHGADRRESDVRRAGRQLGAVPLLRELWQGDPGRRGPSHRPRR